MRRKKLIAWFASSSERKWFYSQYHNFYSEYKRSVVLYAVKRLAKIFRVPLETLEHDKGLQTLADEILSNKRWRKKRVRFCFDDFLWDPMKVVFTDVSFAEDDFLISIKINPDFRMTEIDKNITVADYVRFIYEYDQMSINVERLRVTNSLGI